VGAIQSRELESESTSQRIYWLEKQSQEVQGECARTPRSGGASSPAMEDVASRRRK